MSEEEDFVNLYDWNHLDTPRYLTLAMMLVFSVTGVVGNALVLYVYIKKRDSLISTFFIIVLAAVDFITCLVIIPWTIYLEYVDFVIRDDVQCKVYQFLVSSNIPFSAFIMVAIAIDRYFSICHPFVHAITLTRAQIIVCIMAVYAAILGSLVACMFSVYNKISRYEITNSTFYNRTATDGVYNSTTHNINNNDSHFIYYHCQQSTAIFTVEFISYYHKYHVAQYVLCFVCIVSLYSLIYLKVYSRRSRRLKQSLSQAVPLVPRNTTICTQETDVTVLHNGDSKKLKSQSSLPDSTGSLNSKEKNSPCDDKSKDALDIPSQDTMSKVSEGNQEKECLKKRGEAQVTEQTTMVPRRSSRRDRVRMANIRTAVMLSVVAIVFVVTYAPAFIMSCLSIFHTGYLQLAYYIYFANNVANPVIYSFMNKNFRNDLKQLVSRRRLP